MTGALLAEADDVAAVYPGAAAPAVTSLTFAVRGGERVAVLGPNGGGKTTLFRLLTGELRPASGTLVVPAGRVALVPQTEHSRLDYPVSAADVALMGAVARTAWWRRPSRSDRALAREALARVGLAEHAGTTFGELSGGQRRRALVARALVQDASLLLLDEPYAGLDTPSSRLLDALLEELAAEGRGVLIATHDLEQARASDLVLCLNRVQVAFGPPQQALRLEVIERTYGTALLPLTEGGRALLPADRRDHEERGR
jgi:ABC-type Mn2+/Zn2+ transport system ATPase subunit